MDSPITKHFKRKYVQALKAAGEIQDRIKEYSRKLNEVRDKITRISPEKWEEEDLDQPEDEELSDLDEYVDLTPAKGSLSKIEKKRKIFDMLSCYNEVLRRYLGCFS